MQQAIYSECAVIIKEKDAMYIFWLAGGHDYTPPGSAEKVPTLASWPVLYDMEYDKSESYNVIKRHPDIAQMLHKKMESFEKDFYANIRGWK